VARQPTSAAPPDVGHGALSRSGSPSDKSWNGLWTGDAVNGCVVCNVSDRAVLSVLLARPVRDACGMVRRRSTVRFRKGAPS